MCIDEACNEDHHGSNLTEKAGDTNALCTTTSTSHSPTSTGDNSTCHPCSRTGSLNNNSEGEVAVQRRHQDGKSFKVRLNIGDYLAVEPPPTEPHPSPALSPSPPSSLPPTTRHPRVVDHPEPTAPAALPAPTRLAAREQHDSLEHLLGEQLRH
ncbi:hypothetical protein FOPE_04869 [Fonsecaea pedrosoi]|nr:hypothetical protein FOPE_04869 [Fonsecaea pedrosoi]